MGSTQSNGQVERVKRVIRSILAKLTKPVEHSDWVDKLSRVEFTINNRIHCTTKQSPSRLLFGTEQRGLIIDELTEYLRETYGDESVNLDNIRE